MKFQPLLDLLSLPEYTTYAEASKKLKLSKPEIIKLIKELEQELEVKIINSKQDEINLTEFGLIVLTEFKKYGTLINQEVGNAIRDIENIKGTIRILLPQYIFLELADFFVGVHKAYPLVKLDVDFYDGSTLNYKTDLDFDLIIHDDTPEVSMFYMHKVGVITERLFCTKTFLENHENLTDAASLALNEFNHSIICTTWVNRLVLQSAVNNDKVTIPQKNIAATADNIYNMLYKEPFDDFIFVAKDNTRLVNSGYINIFPEYYTAQNEVYLFRNKCKDSALVVNIEKRLKAFLVRYFHSFE